MPSGRITKTYLGEAATRLARLLGVDGLITPLFDSEEKLQPVILMGDTTDPGYSERSAMRWAIAGVAAGGGVGAYIGIEATREIVVQGVNFGANTANGQFTLKWNTSAEASPSGATFPTFVPQLDRAVNRDQAAPVLFLAQGGAAPAAVNSRTLWVGLAAANGVYDLPFEFHMNPGSRLWIEYSTVAATIYASFRGRTF